MQIVGTEGEDTRLLDTDELLYFILSKDVLKWIFCMPAVRWREHLTSLPSCDRVKFKVVEEICREVIFRI